MHSGAYATLEEVVRHHMHPEKTLRDYTGDDLPATHRDSVQTANSLHDEMVSYLSDDLGDCSEMGDDEVDALVAFLKAMTDPSARDMSDVVPFSVPSGFHRLNHPDNRRPPYPLELEHVFSTHPLCCCHRRLRRLRLRLEPIAERR